MTFFLSVSHAVQAPPDVSTATLTADKISMDGGAKSGRAEGNVRLETETATLTGDEIEYHWESETGVVRNATGINPPWRFTAEKLTQTSPEIYFLDEGTLTSCDEVPPHYRIKSNTGKVRRGKRMTMKNARLVPDQTGIFWTPFYTRSLVPKKYRLRIEPGQTSRDGITVKTLLGYPFTPNTWTTARWDYLQYTGNGGGLQHIYNAPNVKGNFDSYYVRDTNPDPQPQSRRYTVLWNHYQRLTQRLAANAKLDIKSDQTFGNQFADVGNEVYVENQVRGLLSEGGFNYQFDNATMQMDFERKDKFDSTVSSRQFISRLTLPRITFNTAPLTSKKLPFYTSFNGSWTNDTQERTDPDENLRYKRSATAGAEVKKDFKVGKAMTLTPLLGYNESWDNRVLSSTYVVTEKDQYVGRYTTGLDGRRRFFRRLDLRLGYRYQVRNRVNQTKQEFKSNDYGVEINSLTGSFQTRIGRSSLVTLSSGYDYREAPRDDPEKYKHSSERITPPSFDLQYEVKKDVNLYFRETYSIYDSRTDSLINTPVNTSGELQLGNPVASRMFSQGFSYSKKSPGEDSQLFLTSKLKFYMTNKWYVDLLLSYRAVGEQKLDYRKVFPIERTIRVVRDLHCWILRAEFSSRPGRTDASFYIDLKANAKSSKNIFQEDHPSVYSTRNDGPDYDELFPPATPHDGPSAPVGEPGK